MDFLLSGNGVIKGSIGFGSEYPCQVMVKAMSKSGPIAKASDKACPFDKAQGKL
jgi:hypothetical protein